MDFLKKILHFLSSVLFYSVVLVLGIAFLMFGATFVDKKLSASKGINRSPLFGAYVIISESMIPSINVYDAVLTIRATEDDIKTYDIITFLSKDIETAGTPITHRVVDIVHDQNDNSKIIGYRTKGDHNNTADFALIAPDEVIGKVFLRIPMIGYLQTIMTKPIGWLMIVVIPCLLIIGSDILKLIKTSRMKDEDQEDNNSKLSSLKDISSDSVTVIRSDKEELLDENNKDNKKNK